MRTDLKGIYETAVHSINNQYTLLPNMLMAISQLSYQQGPHIICVIYILNFFIFIF